MTTNSLRSTMMPGGLFPWGRQVFLFLARAFAVALLFGARLGNAQDDEDSPYRPGLVATYSASASSVTRTDEVLAFDWQDGACDPRLPAGEFSAVWRGRLWARGSGAYRMFAYACGDVTVKIAGKQVVSGSLREPAWLASEPLELEFDHHPLEVTYRRTGPRGQVALFWAGPDFQLEPIPARALMHDREQTPATDFERGRQLAAALRCAACHKDDSSPISPAPALDRLTGNMEERWMIHWLSDHGDGNAGFEARSRRRMPLMSIDQEQASAIAAWLLREPALAAAKAVEQKETKVTKGESGKTDTAKKSSSKAKKGEEKPRPSAEAGERVLLTRGCLACHQYGSLGESGLFGGGRLKQALDKRPLGFLTRWLQNPAAINRSHRMPVFTLTADELESVRLWEEDGWRKTSPGQPISLSDSERKTLVRQGEALVGEFRCANCHLPTRNANELAKPAQRALSAQSDWARSCLDKPDAKRTQPGYRLDESDRVALRAFYSQERPSEQQLSPQARGRDLLVQLNCLACHQREGIDRTVSLLPAVLQDKLVEVAADYSALAEQVPAMTPPALNSVGDKLHDEALAASISRDGPPHRPYLLVQMPKFKLSKNQLDSLTAYFTTTDRIPVGNALRGVPPAPEPTPALLAAGPRLVTTDGLACTSCHAVGSVQPAKAPLNARGPDMSMLGKRIRREWFDRWCADPARIVPRMEMPSVKIPVRGVLNDNVHDQLAAVWHILNTPGFEPPEPNPVRTLRLSGVPEKNERPIVIHDVVKDGDKTYLYPLMIGLPNRHNVLFDLETNRLAAWWLGDTARQRTKGKSWYWEMGGKSLVSLAEETLPGPVLIHNGKEIQPGRVGQFAAELTHWLINAEDSRVGFRLRVPYHVEGSTDALDLTISETFAVFLHPQKDSSGVYRVISIASVPTGSKIRLPLFPAAVSAKATWDAKASRLYLADGKTAVRISTDGEWQADGSLILEQGPNRTPIMVALEYETQLPVDQFITTPPPPNTISAAHLEVAPGFTATRLPLGIDIMPSGFAWLPDGGLVFCTLKGEVYSVPEETTGQPPQLIVDGLATPYGLAIPSEATSGIDVSTKSGLMRLFLGVEGILHTVGNVASPWGRTDDYHDWSVGPVPGEVGSYFLALPCQQDQRSDAAADYRGKIIRIKPRWVASRTKEPLDIEVISSGHRFPMGMARNREGELFVTDNQGNYNPFNELNHVRKGAHFGFINALEKQNGYQPPPLTPPAINIPHPWTRSVNGICFLDTPSRVGLAHQDAAKDAATTNAKVGTAHPTSLYGPLEGHLVGCEYDTRRLIRMSLQKIGDTYQGAAYPLSIPTEDVEKGLLGPIVCAIKPTTGELYVGEIRDSGWGASNNIGQIVKIKIEPEKFPCGIAEVRATSNGFTVDFLQAVDAAKALDTASYSIESYRRESTPAYGGSDIDRRSESERIKNITLSPDKKRATLTFSELRTGHVYEFKLKNMTPGGGMFHPDEAHYTLHRLPE